MSWYVQAGVGLLAVTVLSVAYSRLYLSGPQLLEPILPRTQVVQLGDVFWGVSLMRGRRGYMEDTAAYLASSTCSSTQLFGVFDGHANDVSLFLFCALI